MDRKQISIIIPVYNSGDYIGECLRSVTMQNDVDMEIICVDDASTDNSALVIDEISKKDDRIHMIAMSQNSGQAAARNAGLRIACGRYVYFLDSDDLLSRNDALKVLCEYADYNQTDGICFESSIEYEDESLKELLGNREKIAEHISKVTMNGPAYFCRMINSPGFSIAVWRQFWRRAYLTENELWFCEETSPHEDLLFTFKAIFSSSRMCYLPEVLHIYRFRSNSCSSGLFTKKRFHSYMKIYAECMKYIEKIGEFQFSFREEQTLMKYFDYIYAPVYENYAKLVINGEDIWNDTPEWMCGWEVFWGKKNILGQFPMLERIFTPMEYRQIASAGKVILYGAGRYSDDMQKMLADFEINDFILAVTEDPKDEKIKSIMELRDYCDTAIVIIAVSGELKNVLENNAKNLGFKNIINLKEC